MPVAKVLLFYVFAPLPDPEAVRLWQRDLCESLGLRGRILLSKDGLNGTLGGELDSLKRYLRKTRDYAAFSGLDAKWSERSGLDAEGGSLDFPRLSVRVRDEIVSFGAPNELVVGAAGVVGGGSRLDPDGVHALVEARDDVVFFDGRNRFEAEIGRFRDAVVPAVATTREFIAELDSGKYDHLKGRPVVHVLHRRCPLRGPERADALTRVPGGLPARRRGGALRRALRGLGTVGGVAVRVRRARLVIPPPFGRYDRALRRVR